MSLNYTDGIYCLTKIFVLRLKLILLPSIVIDIEKCVTIFKAKFYRI